VWHPQFLWYDWNGRVLRMQTADGWVDVVPGDGQWVVFAPSGVERGWMGGAVRALAIPWLIRQWAYRDWARYSEVHGMPTRKALVPQNAPQDQKDAFLNELAALGTEATVVLPQGTDAAGSFNFLLEEAKSNTWEGFQRLIAQVDASIAVTLLGQNLTTEVNAGSRAAAQVHADVKQTILEADAQTLATTLREQALKPWALFNYGDAELAPFPNWKTDPPEDRKANADALSTLATALKTLKDAQINVDAEALLEKAGVVVLDDLPPPPAPKPGKLDRLADVPTPVLEGQLYADDVADAARQLGVNVMSPDLNEVLRQIHLAHDFDDMRTRLVETYRRMDPTTLQRLLERAELLAELDGRYRVSQEK
jgi:phage gp29-like protein